jgi:membrane-associated phospholipid phosphatase
MDTPASPLLVRTARALSLLGHPGLLVPVAVAVAASRSGVPPQWLPVALGTAVVIAVLIGLYSLWQVGAGRWAHIDASNPHERQQLNLFLGVLLGGATALLWLLGQPVPLMLGPALAAAMVGVTHLLRRHLKVSLHAAFAVFSLALVWPHALLTPALALLAAAVGWSRLVLRRHTPNEVVLGLLLGACGGIAFRALVA